MRTCCICKAEKPEDAFAWKVKGLKLSGKCRGCTQAYFRQHYQANRARYLKNSKRNNRRAKLAAKRLIWQHLLTHPCVDCGEPDPVVLDFDHKRRSNKSASVANLVGWSLRVIQAEIAKCHVRCANCHRRRTAKQLGWRIDPT
jgi:hypothetical protein